MCLNSSKLKMVGNVFTSHHHEDTGINSMIVTFNTAVTETASEILGKHHQNKKNPGTPQKFLIRAIKKEKKKKRNEKEKIQI